MQDDQSERESVQNHPNRLTKFNISGRTYTRFRCSSSFTACTFNFYITYRFSESFVLRASLHVEWLDFDGETAKQDWLKEYFNRNYMNIIIQTIYQQATYDGDEDNDDNDDDDNRW